MNRLAESEIQLLQNVALSLSEEVDIFYAREVNLNIFGPEAALFTKDSLKERVIHCVEMLENMQSDSPSFNTAL